MSNVSIDIMFKLFHLLMFFPNVRDRGFDRIATVNYIYKESELMMRLEWK